MPRTDVVNIGTNVQDVRKSVAFMPYSRVIVTVDEETEYEAGNTSGLTLEVYCPWGSQAMANNILTAIMGYQYQPYTATGALADPAAEMGDAVNVNSVYGGLYQQDITFGHTFYSDFSAPEDEQLDHEFTYESPTERRITRQTAWAKAEFRITNNAIEAEVSARQADSTEFRATLSAHASEIAARVTQRGGNNASFGWSLISTAFILYSGNKAVFTCNSGGISVDGNITARSGYIGNGSSYNEKLDVNSCIIHKETNYQLDGVSEDYYTGIWECTLVPSYSKITVDSKRRINVGVWKKVDGTIRDSNYKSDGNQDSAGENKGSSSAATTSSGQCYGNGTTNAVLGYGVQFSTVADYVETAQKR